MNGTAELTTLQPAEGGTPLTAQQLKARLATIQAVMRDVMQKDVDYGVIPGTDKPSLFKPGAEKLCVTFRLTADDPMIDAVQDGTVDIRYRVRVPVRSSDGSVLAVGIGECSTGEEKYRWRRPVHPKEFDAAPEDMRREKWTRGGDVWQQVRVSPPDVANTVLKMAHKRAYVHAVIMATAAGAIFTQDIEDLPDGVDHADVKPAVQQPQRKAPAPAATAKPPAGAGAVVVIRIKDITKKEGVGDKGPWTKTTIEAITGQRYGTFDTEIAKLAREAMASDAEVEIAYTEDKYGKTIQSFSQVGREPGAEG